MMIVSLSTVLIDNQQPSIIKNNKGSTTIESYMKAFEEIHK